MYVVFACAAIGVLLAYVLPRRETAPYTPRSDEDFERAMRNLK